jgi:hypothetical protein
VRVPVSADACRRRSYILLLTDLGILLLVQGSDILP